MTGNEIINMCSAIIKRQDLNRDLLLMFINQQRRFILRSNYLYKIQRWITNFEPEDGFVNTNNPSVGVLKQARYVEWNPDPEENVAIDFSEHPYYENGIDGETIQKSGRKKKLLRLNTIQEVFEFIDNVDAIGEPAYYVVMQDGLKIIPAPTVGVINIFGEWYPPDLVDTTESLEQDDKLNKEISDVIIFNACAEYFDFLEEYEKAQMWRTKGQAQLDAYLLEIKRQMTDDRDLMERDPFGNLGIHHGWRDTGTNIYNTDELTGGTPGDYYSGN